ncbi:hypothetical protein [Pseudoramibacter faecis]|uniref:hypothetical protein n=1 Tax=Pseudoramibacter faecis TaxID=3108534 RepID=UPI002E7792FD|nr:hypothetical protein [Pseudoramibacter sp. HA2172]
MLGKLLKYEMKETWRLMAISYLAIIACALVSRLTLLIPGNTGSVIQAIFQSLYGVLFVAIPILLLVMIVKRFYDNLLGSQGYLTMTLPVRPAEHIGAKLLSAVIWTLATAVVVPATLFIIARDLMPHHYLSLAELSQVFGAIGRYHLWLPIVECVLLVLFGLAASILMFYLAMAIGQLVNRHRGALSVFTYIGISVVLQILSFISIASSSEHLESSPFRALSTAQATQLASVYLGVILLIQMLLCALFFGLTTWLLGRHLNLE